MGVPILPAWLAGTLYESFATPEPDITQPTPEELAVAAGQSVEICSQGAGSEQTEHWWLRVGAEERGMGQAVEGGIPGPGIPTMITDHDERSRTEDGVYCAPAREVNPAWDADGACVLEQAAVGTPTGRYGAPDVEWGDPLGLGAEGVVNHCQDAVADILTSCSSDPEAAAELDMADLHTLEEIGAPAKAGATPDLGEGP